MPTEPSASPRLKLFLLGQFAVEYGGDPVPASAWKRRRPVELLTALALAPGHVLHREEIIDRLWPDKSLESGANNLYRTLHDLRRVTADDVVFVERGAVRLHDDSWVDVVEFERAASGPTHEHLLRAIDLYRGNLLPDDPYSELVEPRRVGLRQRFLDVALRLAGLEDELDLDRRIGVLRRLLDVEPTLEEAHRRLMTALAERGRVADACAQFVACSDALRDRLDVPPSAQTRALLDQIKAGRVMVRSKPELADAEPEAMAPVTDATWTHVAERLFGTTKPSPIRGRADELAVIEQFVQAGSGALVIIGEAGAGKTRIAVECARQCAAEGAVVLAGLGCEFEGAAPYTPFVDAWADLSGVRTGAENPFLTFEPVPGASAQEDRLRLLRAVERSLFDLAGQGRVCVLIEDIHQADESSLQLFHHLARASRHLPLQLIGTLREEEIHIGNPLHTLLGSLARERVTRRLVLQRLDRAATRELIVDLWGTDPDPSSVSTVYGLAGGNPFFTEQLATAVREAGGESFTPSSDIMETVRARMSRLGPDVERLLIAASVQGVRFDFEIAHTTAGLEPEPALDALDMTLSARIVEERESKYRFRHALLREALYDSLSSARRIYLHRATATALEGVWAGRGKPDPELLAFHHHAAGNLEQALPYVMAAIERAQSRLGFGEAVTYCQRALEIMDSLGTPPGSELFSVLRNMGGMRVALGDLEAAVNDLDWAASLKRTSPPWTPEPAERCWAKRMTRKPLPKGTRCWRSPVTRWVNGRKGGSTRNVAVGFRTGRWMWPAPSMFTCDCGSITCTVIRLKTPLERPSTAPRSRPNGWEHHERWRCASTSVGRSISRRGSGTRPRRTCAMPSACIAKSAVRRESRCLCSDSGCC